jgi:hypothetical protein
VAEASINGNHIADVSHTLMDAAGDAAPEEHRRKRSSPDKKPAYDFTEPHRRLYFSIDVEKAGKHQTDSLIAVGICVAALPEGVLEKRRWCLPNVTRFEPRCVAEFWSKFPALLVELVNEGKNEVAVHQFLSIETFLRSWETRLSNSDIFSYNGRAVLVSDNPSYDLYHFDVAMEACFPDHNPLHYTRSGAYRPVEDCSERLEAQGLNLKVVEKFLADIGVSNDHKPGALHFVPLRHRATQHQELPNTHFSLCQRTTQRRSFGSTPSQRPTLRCSRTSTRASVSSGATFINACVQSQRRQCWRWPKSTTITPGATWRRNAPSRQ